MSFPSVPPRDSPRRSHRSRPAAATTSARRHRQPAPARRRQPASAIVGQRHRHTAGRGCRGTRPCPTPTRRRRSQAAATRRPTDLFAAYTRSSPDNPWGHYMYGLSAWKAGDHERAIEASTRRCGWIPSTGRACSTPPACCWRPAGRSEALERVERALAIEPLSGEGLRLLGRARYELRQIPEAIDAYQRALALDEHDVWAMNNLGLIYIQQDRSDAALAALARAVELRGNCAGLPEQPRHRAGAHRPLRRGQGRRTRRRSRPTAPMASPPASLARVTPHVEGDTTTVDLAALATEFQAEVQRWRDTTVHGFDCGTVDVERIRLRSVEIRRDRHRIRTRSGGSRHMRVSSCSLMSAGWLVDDSTHAHRHHRPTTCPIRTSTGSDGLEAETARS